MQLGDLLPDHGHLMHLFLVRTPALDRFFHLHPDEQGNAFVQQLPPMPAGRYQVFGDIVHASGFPETAVGEITLPESQGVALEGDDSAAAAEPVGGIPGADTVAALGTGMRAVRLGPARLIVGETAWLQFRVEDILGNPVTDLEPYMGMSSHLEVIRQDLTVFAHLHPSGSPPMVAMALANGSPTDQHSGHSAVSPELAFPYGFPQAGLYRLFVQVKRASQVETAVFDVQVAHR